MPVRCSAAGILWWGTQGRSAKRRVHILDAPFKFAEVQHEPPFYIKPRSGSFVYADIFRSAQTADQMHSPAITIITP